MAVDIPWKIGLRRYESRVQTRFPTKPLPRNRNQDPGITYFLTRCAPVLLITIVQDRDKSRHDPPWPLQDLEEWEVIVYETLGMQIWRAATLASEFSGSSCCSHNPFSGALIALPKCCICGLRASGVFYFRSLTMKLRIVNTSS